MKGQVKSKIMRIVIPLIIIAGGIIALYNFKVGMAVVAIAGALAAITEVF